MAKKKLINAPAEIPAYQKEFYSRVYESKRLTKILDKQWLRNILSLGYSKKLAQACIDEVQPGQRVLQIGVTLGDELGNLAAKLGVYGRLDVVDVSLNRLMYVRNKYRFLYPTMSFINRDALEPFKEKYDVIICYMLLHELPLISKNKLINLILSSLSPDGKAVFIEYNNAVWWHPLKWLVKIYNRLYQPFAEKMWQSEIRDFAADKNLYNWRKTTFFGKMYQKLTAIRREGLF